jgi:formamidopyrimidine-DNA glycosylase
MPKKPERSELEYLKGENRQLKRRIKHLQKELNRALANPPLPEEKEEKEKVITKERCPDCGNKLESINLPIKIIHICKECGYRRVKELNGIIKEFRQKD